MGILHCGLLLLSCIAGSTSTGPKIKDHCKDDMLNLADGRYSCALLVDRSHPYQRVLGVYRLRKDLCSKHEFSGCCKTCTDNGLQLQNKRRKHKKSKFVYQMPIISMTDDRSAKTVCENRMLNVAGGFYSCSLLTDPDHLNEKIVGAFKHRKELCSKPHYSGCCKTCKELFSEVQISESQFPEVNAPINLPVQAVEGIELNPHCKDSGLVLNEGTFSCAMLVDEFSLNLTAKRAMAKRNILCNLPNQSGCCLTCTLYGLYEAKEKKDKRQTSSTIIDPDKEHPDSCRDSSLWLGDGSYDCSLLVDKHHKKQEWIGVYDQRKRLCSKAEFSGCCQTCLKHVIKRNSHGCKDEYVYVSRNKKTYACRELLHRRSDIYTDRFDLCMDTANTKCCKTCTKVFSTKNQHGSHRHMNMISKPKTTRVHVSDNLNPKPVTRETVEGVNRAYLFMKAILHRLSQLVHTPKGVSQPKHHRHLTKIV